MLSSHLITSLPFKDLNDLNTHLNKHHHPSPPIKMECIYTETSNSWVNLMASPYRVCSDPYHWYPRGIGSYNSHLIVYLIAYLRRFKAIYHIYLSISSFTNRCLLLRWLSSGASCRWLTSRCIACSRLSNRAASACLPYTHIYTYLYIMYHMSSGIYKYHIYGTALGTPTPPPRGWSWFPAPPPVGVGGVVVDGWQCWLMES